MTTSARTAIASMPMATLLASASQDGAAPTAPLLFVKSMGAAMVHVPCQTRAFVKPTTTTSHVHRNVTAAPIQRVMMAMLDLVFARVMHRFMDRSVSLFAPARMGSATMAIKATVNAAHATQDGSVQTATSRFSKSHFQLQ